MAIPPADPSKKPKGLFSGSLFAPKKKVVKEETKVSAPAAPSIPIPTLKGQRKRRQNDGDGENLGHCRSGRLLGAIQHLTAVLREKPELAPMLFRATVAKVLANRLSQQLLTSSAVVLNNIFA